MSSGERSAVASSIKAKVTEPTSSHPSRGMFGRRVVSILDDPQAAAIVGRGPGEFARVDDFHGVGRTADSEG